MPMHPVRFPRNRMPDDVVEGIRQSHGAGDSDDLLQSGDCACLAEDKAEDKVEDNEDKTAIYQLLSYKFHGQITLLIWQASI